MFKTMWSFFIYGPLFLVAFILSIVAMAQRRVLGGMLLLLATLIVPTILSLYLFASRTTEALVSHSLPETTTYQNTLRVESAPVAAPDTSTSPEALTPMQSHSSTEEQIAKASVEPGPSKNQELDAKMGFRKYRLGTPIAEFNSDDIEAGQAFIKTDMKPFFARNFDRKLGAAEIDSIQLHFNEDLLESVVVMVKGEQNAIALQETLIAGYGPPDDTSNFMTKTLTWNGDNCVLSLDFQLMGDASARFSSKSVTERIKALKLEKAKAGAAAGADSL